MATIYNVEVVSDWVNHPIEDMQKILDNAIKEVNKNSNNTIRLTVKDRK